MPLENDLWAITQAASSDPNGLTPEAAVTKLKQFREEKRAKAAQRKSQNIADPNADADLSSYDFLDDADFVKEVLPQALYEAQQSLKAAPQAPQAIQLGAGLPKPPAPGPSRTSTSDFNNFMGEATNAAKWGTEVAANTLPALGAGLGPAGLAAAIGIPNLLTLMRGVRGGKPQDFSTSLAQGVVGKAVNAGSGPLADFIRKRIGGAAGGFNGVDLGVGMAGGAANAALPPMFNDQTGFEVPEDTASRAGLGAGVGALGTLVKQLFGLRTGQTGTVTLEKMEQKMGLPQGAVDRFGAPSLAGQRLLEGVSERKPVVNELQKFVSATSEHEAVKRALTGKTLESPQVREMARFSALNKDGSLKTDADTIRAGVTGAFDKLFGTKAAGSATAADAAANDAAEMGRGLIALHKGDKSAALKSALGYFYDRFYRKASAGSSVEPEALETLNSVSGGERLNKLFRGMGLTGKEASEAIATVREASKAMDKISRVDKLAGTPMETGRVQSMRAAPDKGGLSAWVKVSDLVQKGMPSNVAEATLRGKHPIMSEDMQKVMAKWLRRQEKAPLAKRQGQTGIEQLLFSGARDPEKR